MSDNIDYDELDKAVNAAISARNATKAQSTPAQKPVATPKAPQKAAVKPAHRGVVMDFAPRKSASPAPDKKPVAKRPAPAPIKRLVSRPAVKPVTKTVAKPTIAAARPVSKPVMRPAAKPVAKPAPKPVEKAEPKEEPKPEPILKKREAPNANNYSLGGRSPFMTNAKVEKRPLGKRIPETSTSALRSTHNIYSQKNPARATENAKKHIVTQDPKKQSGWLWTLIVLGVILAGGGLGYLAYLLVFAH